MTKTIIGGNADRPANIHTFPTVTTTTGLTEMVECDGVVISSFEKITGGQIEYALEGSMNGTDWASLDDAKTKAVGNYIHSYSGAGYSITMTVCCD